MQYSTERGHSDVAALPQRRSQKVGVPMAKEDDNRGSEKELDRISAKQYRRVVARMDYLGQDRSQIQFTIKGLSRGVVKPTEKNK